MAIQFQCVSCTQPIEVDDQWARRLVECPYCHDTVTVPAISTIHSSGVAAPVPQQVSMGHPNAHSYYRPQSRNALAIWALVLSILAVTALGATIAYAAIEISARVGPNASPEEIERLSEELINKAADRMEPWVVVLGLGMLGGFGLWIAGLVCSIIAVTRQARRGLAVAALLVSLFPAVILLLM